MRPVAPRTGAPEATIAEDQTEYQPITICCYMDAAGNRVVLTRWKPSAEDLARLNAGEDLYVSIIAGDAVPPLQVQVGPEGWIVPEDPPAG